MAATEPLGSDKNIDLSNDVFKYFSRTNHINKTVLLQEKCLKKHLGNQWETMPQDRRDDLLDLLFVDEDVREKYDFKGEQLDVEECFPRLLLNMGQKINVDFENELWTWKDEHSGPFSWMSKSQQDLTMADLEPETILKPQPKQPRVDLDDESSVKKASPQFKHPCNSWCHDLIEDYKKNQEHIALTPSPSLDFDQGIRTAASAEELNLAFENSQDDDVTAQSSQNRVIAEQANSSDTDKAQKGSDEKNTSKKDRGRKSPSPKKTILNSGSFKKSPVKKSDRGKDEKLIAKGDDSLISEAYSNPAMESEWSTFVGEKPTHPVTEAPQALSIDRGGGAESRDVSAAPSPYRGDQDRLISEAEDSPAVPRCAVPSWLDRGAEPSDESVESTPDHKTHLLKGIQSPAEHSQRPGLMEVSHGKVGEFHYDDSDEILTVSVDNLDVKVTSTEPEKRESNIPSTGFDFLDNW